MAAVGCIEVVVVVAGTRQDLSAAGVSESAGAYVLASASDLEITSRGSTWDLYMPLVSDFHRTLSLSLALISNVSPSHRNILPWLYQALPQ